MCRTSSRCGGKLPTQITRDAFGVKTQLNHPSPLNSQGTCTARANAVSAATKVKHHPIFQEQRTTHGFGGVPKTGTGPGTQQIVPSGPGENYLVGDQMERCMVICTIYTHSASVLDRSFENDIQAVRGHAEVVPEGLQGR
jgi:hypothetical protein